MLFTKPALVSCFHWGRKIDGRK